MMLAKYFLPALTLATSVTISWLYFASQKPTFSCTGAYRSEIQIAGDRLVSTINISMSFFKRPIAFLTLEGSVSHNGKQGHLYREVWYHYTPLDPQHGLYRIQQTNTHKGNSDNLNIPQLDQFLLGAEGSGRLIRIWKLNDKVILIGNAFSPVMSCTKIS